MDREAGFDGVADPTVLGRYQVRRRGDEAPPQSRPTSTPPMEAAINAAIQVFPFTHSDNVTIRNRGRTGKRLANCLQGGKIAKNIHARRVQETKWEIPVK
jgi:hypothetical protein